MTLRKLGSYTVGTTLSQLNANIKTDGDNLNSYEDLRFAEVYFHVTPSSSTLTSVLSRLVKFLLLVPPTSRHVSSRDEERANERALWPNDQKRLSTRFGNKGMRSGHETAG